MGMQSGFSSPRRDMFPAGLRVLVVDDDMTWLKILEKMLKKCSYEVTTCGLAREALRLLRDRKDGFDIVISDVNMPDMDGFKLLEHVGLKMDLPVIMMSVDGETSRVMRGVQHGACDYLLKPIRMKELKNIWQHVVRKRLHDVRDIEGFECRNEPNDGLNYGGDQSLLKKRKDVDNERESSDPFSAKKARVVWTVELHQKFVKAVNRIGIDSDKVGPKKILDLMEVPWLTRENVASHLQKYRLYLSRIRKEGETEGSFEGMKNMVHSPKESSGSFTFHDSNVGLHNDVSSNNTHTETQLPVNKPKDSKPHVKTQLPVYPWTKETREMKFESEFTLGPHLLEPTPGIPCAPDPEVQFGCDQTSVIGFESTSRSVLGLPGEDLTSYWIQNDGGTPKDIGFDYVGFSEYIFTEHISEVPAPPYAPKFGIDFEYPFDCYEYPVDQGLTWV